MRVKICGITDLEAALSAVEAGADALGFVFVSSRRRISPPQAREIIRAIPPFVVTVGVFANNPLNEVHDIVAYCGLDYVQLHGQEPPAYCKQFSRPVIKGFRVRDRASLEELTAYSGVAALLLDGYHPTAAGGGGISFDWEIIQGVAFPRPLILAGGLSPENVADAITRVRPYAVDVSSGVETNGRKDPARMQAFVQNAKEAFFRVYATR